MATAHQTQNDMLNQHQITTMTQTTTTQTPTKMTKQKRKDKDSHLAFLKIEDYKINYQAYLMMEMFGNGLSSLATMLRDAGYSGPQWLMHQLSFYQYPSVYCATDCC